MNTAILLPERKIEYFGYLVSFKYAVQVEQDHRIKCAWATFSSHRQDLTSSQDPLRQTQALRRHGDTITLLRIRFVDDDGRDEE